jgi:hypothetical protein
MTFRERLTAKAIEGLLPSSWLLEHKENKRVSRYILCTAPQEAQLPLQVRGCNGGIYDRPWIAMNAAHVRAEAAISARNGLTVDFADFAIAALRWCQVKLWPNWLAQR